MFKEFKAFVNQGNAIDLAVGVLIGAAFGKIVNSIVQDIITPILSTLMGGTDFSNMFVPLKGQTATNLVDAKKEGAVIAYGLFINNVIEFFTIAFTIFLIVRQINKYRGTPAAK